MEVASNLVIWNHSSYTAVIIASTKTVHNYEGNPSKFTIALQCLIHNKKCNLITLLYVTGIRKDASDTIARRNVME